MANLIDRSVETVTGWFNDRTPGQFEWTYLEQGPDTWRVSITRLKAPHGSDGSCCGSCGG